MGIEFYLNLGGRNFEIKPRPIVPTIFHELWPNECEMNPPKLLFEAFFRIVIYWPIFSPKCPQKNDKLHEKPRYVKKFQIKIVEN